jgi:hypothetical protein
MNVSPHVGGRYYSYDTMVGKQITFETTVLNNGTFPLQVVANLTTPFRWELIDRYSNCPASLAIGSSCTFTWIYIPRISGPTWLRVYVRGLYTLPSGISQRITNSPAFLFNVAPL